MGIVSFVLDRKDTQTRQLHANIKWIFDNDDLRTPLRQVAVFENGQWANLNEPVCYYANIYAPFSSYACPTIEENGFLSRRSPVLLCYGRCCGTASQGNIG